MSASASRCIAPVSTAASADCETAGDEGRQRARRATSATSPHTPPTAPPTSGNSAAPRATSLASSATRSPIGTRVRNATAASGALSAALVIARCPSRPRPRTSPCRRGSSRAAASERQRERRAAPLPQPQVELEQRREAECLEDDAVPRLRRAVRGDEVARAARARAERDEGCGAGDEAVEHDDGAVAAAAPSATPARTPISKPPTAASTPSGSARVGRVRSSMRDDDRRLPRHPVGVEAGARAAQLDAGSRSEQRCGERGRRGRVPDPHLPERRSP